MCPSTSRWSSPWAACRRCRRACSATIRCLTQRSLELPSIVPTADGMVGFCTITAQQFQDFLVLIDRPDLLDDDDLASMAGRVRRRDDFLAMVQHWTETRTTDEIVELAAALRIPVAPIGEARHGDGRRSLRRARVFVESTDGGASATGALPSAAIADPAPGFPSGSGRRHRPGGTGRREGRRPEASRARRPSAGRYPGGRLHRVLGRPGGDPGARRRSAPTSSRSKGCAGRTACASPVDGRQAGTNGGNGARSSCAATPTSAASVSSSARRRDGRRRWTSSPDSDLVVENFSPRVMANFDLEWDAVHGGESARDMVRMPAFGLDGPWRDRVGFAQTMEQASGMAWMTGPADGPPMIPRGVRSLGGPACGVRGDRRTRDPGPHRHRGAGRIDDGGGGTEHRRRGGARILTERGPVAPQRKPGPGRQPAGGLPVHG